MLATYEKALRQLYTPEVNKLLLELRQYKQRINRYLDKHAKSMAMKDEEEKAKEISTASSCRIDGVSVPEKCLKELMEGTVEPKSRKEREIASYRFTLNTIDDSFPYIKISTGAILQLHRDLYRYIDVPFAGRWEDGGQATLRENRIGKLDTRLVSSVFITKQTVLRDACQNYKQAIARKACDPLVATCMFALDFINIHPFAEGNGRLSRLMTLLMMYQNDYFVCSYASLEEQIERTKPAYVQAIEAGKRVVPEGGTQDDAETDYAPFVLYLLDAMLACCKKFEEAHELGSYVVEKPAEPEPAPAPELSPQQKAQKKADADRAERLRQREVMQAQAAQALSNPPRMSEAGQSLLAAKEEKVSKAKHAGGLFMPYPSDIAKEQASRSRITPAPTAQPQSAPAPRAAQPATGSTNEEVVRAFFANLEGTASKREVAAACPGMSAKTVERIIQRLMAEGTIVKEGAARSTVYRRA